MPRAEVPARAGADASVRAMHELAVARVLAAMWAEDDELLPLGAMAEIAGFSPFHVARNFQSVVGIPPVSSKWHSGWSGPSACS